MEGEEGRFGEFFFFGEEGRVFWEGVFLGGEEGEDGGSVCFLVVFFGERRCMFREVFFLVFFLGRKGGEEGLGGSFWGSGVSWSCGRGSRPWPAQRARLSSLGSHCETPAAFRNCRTMANTSSRVTLSSLFSFSFVLFWMGLMTRAMAMKQEPVLVNLLSPLPSSFSL